MPEAENFKIFKIHPCIIQLITHLIHKVYLHSGDFVRSLFQSFDKIRPVKETIETPQEIMEHLEFFYQYEIVEDIENSVKLINDQKMLKVLFGPFLEAIQRLGKEKRASANEVFLWFQKFIKYYSKEFTQEPTEQTDELKVFFMKSIVVISFHYHENFSI